MASELNLGRQRHRHKDGLVLVVESIKGSKLTSREDGKTSDLNSFGSVWPPAHGLKEYCAHSSKGKVTKINRGHCII